jgi:outer membrane autotransporter protein
MPVTNTFKLSHLAWGLKLVSLTPLMLFSGYTWAVAVSGALTIDASNPLVSYEVGSAGDLTANGANTLQITTVAGSKLTLNDTNVSAAATKNGVQLTAVKGATITNSHISSDSIGLLIGSLTTGGSTVSSTADVTGGSISGGTRGAKVSLFSTLTLNGTNVTGTGVNSQGVEIFDGTVIATGGTITGQLNGVRMRADPDPAPAESTLTLSGTRVEGVSGSAILVGAVPTSPSKAVISVSNGSTLVGGNGTLLEVIANSTATMTVDNSHLIGDVSVEAGSTANLTLLNHATLIGQLENVASLAVNSQAQWVMVGDSQVGDLSMDGGSVKFGDPGAFYTLSLANLRGNGTFIMEADFAAGQVDFLNVTGQATGNHDLLVSSSGADPLADSSLHVVHTGSGDAHFSLLGGRVDLGTYSYDLVQQGNDWFLASTGSITPATSSVLALFNTAPTVWYGELTSLRSRMGELRMDEGKAGGWMRAYGNKFNVSASSGVGYQQTQSGFSLGADAPVPFGDGQWLVGLMGGYSKSDLDLQQGTSGTVDSYYAGAYSTWIDQQSGYYFDGVLKLNRFQNESKVSMSDGRRAKGDYDSNAVGASLEFGRHIKLENDYFIEPFAQLAGVVIQGAHYNLDNGMSAEGDRTRSLLGKLGSTVGRNFDLGEGRVIQPYVRAAVVHEFGKSNNVQVNNTTFNNDLSGSRGELGMGVAMSLTDKWQVHADFDYSNGDKIEQPWGANVGVRYSW